VVRCAAGLLGWTEAQVCQEAGIALLLTSSLKRVLDIDWNDAAAKTAAVTTLTRQLDTLRGSGDRLPHWTSATHRVRLGRRV